MIDWSQIELVMLDMDGTLLDLHFDNTFWCQHVPRRYAEENGITFNQACSELFPKMREIEGTLDWYCIDYWSETLQLDIPELKRDLKHLIQLRPGVAEFLQAIKRGSQRVILVTNAHTKTVDIKFESADLTPWLDAIISSHTIGAPKESVEFWEKLQRYEPFNRESTLLIDDNAEVLRAAQRYGIAKLLAIHLPDLNGPGREPNEFDALEHFNQIMPSSYN